MLLRSMIRVGRSVMGEGRMVRRTFASGKEEEKASQEVKTTKTKDVVGEEMMDAVSAVANQLHANDKDKAKSVKSSLLSRLISHEKETFDSATSQQTSEMVSDPTVLSILADASTPSKQLPTAIFDRKAKRGLVLLRKEVFYQAVQSGFNAEDARRVSEEAVEEAERRLRETRREETEERKKEEEKGREKKSEREEKEQKLYDLAYKMAQRMLYGADPAAGKMAALSSNVIEPDPSAPKFLSTEVRLNVVEKDAKLTIRRLGDWEDWELRGATIWNEGLGPENAFEEMIEWTKDGKQWTFPIDNEVALGEEERVPFYEHIFIDRMLEQSDLPKSGPIAHFMHLVTVGLSKNPHMPLSKKKEHMQWFISFFNKEKAALIDKLHAQEEEAAANA